MEREWTILHKKFGLPMDKTASTSKNLGTRRVVATYMFRAVKFTSKQKALDKLDEIWMKHGAEQIKNWKVGRLSEAKRSINIRLRKLGW